MSIVITLSLSGGASQDGCYVSMPNMLIGSCVEML